MGIGSNLTNHIKEWGILVMFIVVISIVLLKFSTNNSVVCGKNYIYNASATNCYLSTNSSVTAAVNTNYGTLTTFVTAFSEPKNWVTIVIIAAIGIALLALFNKMKK